MNKGTEIEKVIVYLEKLKQEGYTHVAITTPDKMLRIGSSCPRCLTCFNYSKYRKEDIQ